MKKVVTGKVFHLQLQPEDELSQAEVKQNLHELVEQIPDQELRRVLGMNVTVVM